MIHNLKEIFGTKCTAININGDFSGFINISEKQMKFCAAVSCSFQIPIRISEKNIGCPGARRSLGFNKDDVYLSNLISENNHFDLEFVTRALIEIPVIPYDIHHINLGITEDMEHFLHPDLFIMYIKPHLITRFMHIFAKKNIQIGILPYSLLSVCGNVFANTCNNHKVSLSFGCSESRESGGVSDDEIILGIPFDIAELLAKEIN